MKRIEMIKDRRLFNDIIKNGKFKKNDTFVIYNKDSDIRKFGIAVSKKYGNAVQRNRIKRQVRSIIDRDKNLFKNDTNYIIMIRKGCLDKSFFELESSLTNLLK